MSVHQRARPASLTTQTTGGSQGYSEGNLIGSGTDRRTSVTVVDPGVPSPTSALDALPDGVVIADADGLVTIANAASRRLLDV